MDSMAIDITPGLPISPCLNSLPNELLNHIFDSYDTSYILPPLNRRLLPFHQSQLFRSPILTESKYRRFKAAIDGNQELKGFVRALELEYRPLASRKPVEVSPTRQELSQFLVSLRNLESFTLRARPQIIDNLLPSVEHFKLNPKLVSILAKPWVAEIDQAEDWRDAFDCSKLHAAMSNEDIGSLIGDGSNEFEGPLVLEIRRREQHDTSAFALRYCSHDLLSEQVKEAFKTLRITNLQVLTLDRVSTLEAASNLSDFLSTLADPSCLEHLSLLSLLGHMYYPLPLIDTLASFARLKHLSIAGNIFPSTAPFFEMLRQLPLQSLELGHGSEIDTQLLTRLLSDRRQPARIDLKRLILNNLDAAVPEDEEEAEIDDWIVPKWTQKCSKEAVEKLRIVAKGLGIETVGTTFLALDIEDSVAYQAALERAEEEESEDESDVDEEEEEEGHYRSGYGGYADSDSDGESGYHADAHDDECGCHHGYKYCWRYADRQGWPRRYYGSRRY